MVDADRRGGEPPGGGRGGGDGDVAPLARAARRLCMAIVMVVALVLIFVPSPVLAGLGGGALVLFLALAWRQFGVGTWVPLLLSATVLVLALLRGVPSEMLWRALDRTLFLSALIAMLGTLRAAAAIAPEVRAAGVFVTRQPASRRYLALTLGGHLFGVLINFGGLALLLDLTRRSMAEDRDAQLPPQMREARLRRMTLAVIRGFSMISLWSPFGFATNAILITLPGVRYSDFGPVGFGMSFVFVAIGWAFDRRDGRRFRLMGAPRPSPPPGSWRGAVWLVGHVLALGAGVFLGHLLTPLGFQQALILAVPCYALVWAGWSGRRATGGAGAGIGAAARASWERLSALGAEVGVFASAGFLPVVILALIPAEELRGAISVLGLGPVPLALGVCLSVFGLALIGINPIITASVLGAIAARLAVPGLSNAAIALAITGGWTAVIGLSPFITTLVIGAAIVGRSSRILGPIWNGAYCLTILALWMAGLAGAITCGMI